MSDTEAAMRPAAPQRPPFPGGMPPRPMTGPPRPGGPMQQTPSNFPGNQMRPMPPPLRHVDSKGNVILGPGQGQRPAGPQAPNPMMRPPISGGSGPMNSAGQAAQRPQAPYPWGQQPVNRAPNPYPGNPPARPTFARPPGAPSGQPPFNRPPFQQQMQQQQQQQQQQHQQQQQLQQSQPPQQVQRQPSAGSVQSNSNEDDDDVVMGQAVTPLKSLNLKSDPLRPKIQEAALFGDPTDVFADAAYPIHQKNDKPKTSNLYSLSNNELNGNLTTPAKLPNFQELREADSDKAKNSIPNNIHKGDNDSGVDESTQEKERNGLGSPNSPAKTPTSTASSKPDKDKSDKISRPPSATPSNKSTKSRSTSRNRLLLKTPEPEPAKKVPMNKIQVGHAPSPNLKAVRSKIGSLDNATYKPGGGHVKIETKKVEIKAAPRIEAKNEKYTPRGGDKKIVSTKLQWNAKSKIGSLENTNHKPGGGDKKIETIKTEFKDKAKPKVGSKDNVKHVPGGGDIKIQSQKFDIKAQSKIGSLDNVKHKPGGGEKKIFDDKDYLKNVEHSVALASPPSQSSHPASMTTSTSGADENLNQQQS